MRERPFRGPVPSPSRDPFRFGIRGTVLGGPLLVATLAAGLALPQACLKSDDEIEIIDASLGTPTPSPRKTPTPTPTPRASFLDAFVSSLAVNLTLSDAEAKELAQAVKAGQPTASTSGAEASGALGMAIDDAAAWLVAKEKVNSEAVPRANVGARLLFAGYLAAEEEADASSGTHLDAHLGAVADALGRAFTAFSGDQAPVAADYATFALTIINSVFTQFVDDGADAARVKARAALLVSRMCTAYTGFATLTGAPLAAYVDTYSVKAGYVIPSLATGMAERESYVTSFLDALVAVLGQAVPPADAGIVGSVEAKIREGLAGAPAN